jgi:hypothetical protein
MNSAVCRAFRERRHALAEDCRISASLFQHPKYRKLRRRLGDSGGIALICLWAYTARERSDGSLAGMSDEDIELAADWTGEPDALVRTLVDLRLVDGEAGARCIHGWAEHQPWVVSRGARIDQAKRAAAARWGTSTGVNASSIQIHAPSTQIDAPSIRNDASSNAPNPTQPNLVPNQVKTLCDASAKSADAPRGDGIGTVEIASEVAGPSKGEAKVKSTPPTKKKPKPEKQTDPRYTPTRNLLAAAFRKVCSATEPPPWDGHSAKELTAWLANHNLELPAIEAHICNAAKSEKAEELLRDPAQLIPHLRRYHVPLDRYGFAGTAQRPDSRRIPAVGVAPAAPPEPASEWRVDEPVDVEAGAKLWEELKDNIRPRVDAFQFDVWLKPTRGLGLGKETDTLYVRLPVEEFAPDMGRFDPVLREVLPDHAIKFVAPTLKAQEVSRAC